MLSRFTDWAERRASRQGTPAAFGRATLASVWAMLVGPIFWIALTPMFGPSSDAVLYGLGSSILLSMAGYAATLYFLRRWSR